MKNSVFFLLLLFIIACQTETQEHQLTLAEMLTPSRSGGEPNLFVTKNGDTYLSWIEYLNDSTDALQFSRLENDHWSSPQTIASSTDWFVNWADFPSLVAYENGKNLAAHWLQKRAAGTYDYDIHIAQSNDKGNSWSNSFIPHRDSIAAEHGFVTMIPAPHNRIFATWLDGRNTKTETDQQDDHGHGHGGAMSLRAAEFDVRGNLFEEVELDDKICDCCQTDAAMTSNGPVIVYRDRSDDEIRDISIVRKIGKDWTRPRNISNDQWQITGCPVNGPAISTDGDQIAIAWFTAANEKPMVKVIFSNGLDDDFSSPIQLDSGEPLGRLDIVLKNKKAYVTWLEKTKTDAVIMLAELNAETPALVKKYPITGTSAARASGFPILEEVNGQLLLAWTEVEGEKTRVRTGKLNR